MSTAARKARKRAGIKFEKAPKVGTPIQERAWFSALVWGAPGTRFEAKQRRRSAAKRQRALEARGMKGSK